MVLPVGTASSQAVAAALAAAFAQDPVWSWLLPDPASRVLRLRRFFALEARRVALPHGVSAAVPGDGRLDAAALVLPPGRWRTPLWVQAAFGPAYARVFGARLPVALGVLTAMEREHPREPHVYLAYVGARPAAQGRGHGSALVADAVARADADGLAAYLEASSPDNARLYRRHGFADLEEIRPLGCPPLLLMRRPPARPRGAGSRPAR